MAHSLESVLFNRRLRKNHFTRRYNPTNPNHSTHNQSQIHSTNHPTPSSLQNHDNIRQRRRRKNTKRLPTPNTNTPLDPYSVVNLSNVTLTHDETQLLVRGLTFCPTQRQINWSEVNEDFDEFARRLRITEFFHDDVSSDEPNAFHPKSLWTPPTNRDDALNAFLNAVKRDLLTSKPNRVCDNLPKTERDALRQLKQRHDIIIKSADKGSATVIMDRSWYINECNRQLNNPTFYDQKQEKDKTAIIQKSVAEYVKRMFNNKLIDQKTKQYLVQNDSRPGRFYILPKIHKVNNPGRPIVSSNNHPTERISQFVDCYLKPLVCAVPSYVKDTTDFLNKLTNLNTINTLPDNAILVTLDVTSLYTNIPHSEGIEACRFFLRKRNDKHIPTETLCDLIQIILNMNNFTFNNKHYLQKHGTAMGTKMAFICQPFSCQIRT